MCGWLKDIGKERVRSERCRPALQDVIRMREDNGKFVYDFEGSESTKGEYDPNQRCSVNWAAQNQAVSSRCKVQSSPESGEVLRTRRNLILVYRQSNLKWKNWEDEYYRSQVLWKIYTESVEYQLWKNVLSMSRGRHGCSVWQGVSDAVEDPVIKPYLWDTVLVYVDRGECQRLLTKATYAEINTKLHHVIAEWQKFADAESEMEMSEQRHLHSSETTFPEVTSQ